MTKSNNTVPFEFAKDFDAEDEARRRAEKITSKKLSEEARASMEALAAELRRALPSWQKAQRAKVRAKRKKA